MESDGSSDSPQSVGMSLARVVPALVRAALPIVGVVWLRWPLASILFFYWIELALLSTDSYILFLRDMRGVASLFEMLLGAMAVFAPVTIIGVVAMQDLSSPAEHIDFVLALLDTPGTRASVALQVLVTVVFAVLRGSNGPDGRDRFSNQLYLVTNRFLAVIVAALLVVIMFVVTGIERPEAGGTFANALAVSVVSLVWLFSDLSPERFHRLMSVLYVKVRRRR